MTFDLESLIFGTMFHLDTVGYVKFEDQGCMPKFKLANMAYVVYFRRIGFRRFK